MHPQKDNKKFKWATRKKDIDTLEHIQRKATRIIPEPRDLSYEERLKEYGLTTLETNMFRVDQIEFLRYRNGMKILT